MREWYYGIPENSTFDTFEKLSTHYAPPTHIRIDANVLLHV
ncbi:MAG: hypothetical protein V1885_02850 [Candidatus Brennerbacteria bacterium]